MCTGIVLDSWMVAVMLTFSIMFQAFVSVTFTFFVTVGMVLNVCECVCVCVGWGGY